MRGEIRAVPGDDLPDTVRGERAKQVVGAGEQLARGSSRPRVGEQVIREIGVELWEPTPFAHQPGAGDQRRHRGHLARERAFLQAPGAGDEPVVFHPEAVQVPGLLRQPVRADPGDGAGPECGGGGDAQLSKLRDHLGGAVPWRDPQAVVQRREPEPPQLFAQRVTGRTLAFWNRKCHQAPYAIPWPRYLAERKALTAAVIEYPGGTLAEPDHRAPPALGCDQQPVAGEAAKRRARRRVADAELREQRDKRGRGQRLGPAPPVVAKEREQQAWRPLNRSLQPP